MKWISIEETLPTEDIWILGSTEKRIEMGIWFGLEQGFRLPDNSYLKIDITHWMHLPPLPFSKKQEV
jgi:hypothetical protein